MELGVVQMFNNMFNINLQFYLSAANLDVGLERYELYKIHNIQFRGEI